MTEDAELLRCYATTRSEEAFAELVRRRIGLVYSVALRTTRDAHQAEDVTQMVFADLARKASSLANRPVLASWLYRSAHFAALGVIRTERNRAAREQEVHLMNETLGNDANNADWESVRPVLNHALSELNERDRDAIMLRFFDRRTFADIGAQLRLTENSARMRVERALDKLHALLARRGIRSSTAALGAVLAQQSVAAAPAGLAAVVTGSALASAGATTAAAVSLLHFMSTSKIATGVAGLVVVLALSTAVDQVHASRQAEASVALAFQENDALRVKFRDLQRRIADVDQTNKGLRKDLDEARAAARQRALAAAEKAQAAGDAFMARHPEVKQAALDYQRAQVAGLYAPLFKALQFSPAQIERFKDLTMLNISGKQPNGESISYRIGLDRLEAEKELRAFLEEEGFRLYQDYREFGAPAWALTAKLAGSLFHTASPLASTQGEQLFQILAESRVRTPSSTQPVYDWTAIMPKAEAILTGAQLATLERYRAEDELSQAMAEARRQR